MASKPPHSESTHPALQPSVTNVPVTPGIHTETYQHPDVGSAHSDTSQFYFSPEASKLSETMVEPPSPIEVPEESGIDILRRMSTSSHHRSGSIVETDPRTAYPSLSLSGSIISATFCIPHSLLYRKGSDWVSAPTYGCFTSNVYRNSKRDEEHQLCSTPSPTSPPTILLGIIPWLDGRGKSSLQK